MACEHDGYRDIFTHYDRVAGLLTYYWRCEYCGVLLQEANRLPYRPRFAPLPQARYFPLRPGIAAQVDRADGGHGRRGVVGLRI